MPFHKPDPALLEALRESIRRIESGGASGGTDGLPFGVPEVDAALPRHGLTRAALHAVAGSGRAGDRAASGFCAALLSRFVGEDGTVLWCRSGDDLYGPGLAAFGLDPAHLVVVRAHKGRDVLWAMEESLRSGAPAAVLGEVSSVAPVAARRLQLAAEAGGVTALLLGAAGRANLPTATRWRVSAATSEAPAPTASPTASLGPGHPRWRVELLRARGGGTGIWTLEWRNDATRGFALAADLPNRPADPAVGGPEAPDTAGTVVRLAG